MGRGRPLPQSRAIAERGPGIFFRPDLQLSESLPIPAWKTSGFAVGSCRDGVRGGRGALGVVGPRARVGGGQLSRNCWPFESGCVRLCIHIRSIKTRIVSQLRRASFMPGAGRWREEDAEKEAGEKSGGGFEWPLSREPLRVLDNFLEGASNYPEATTVMQPPRVRGCATCVTAARGAPVPPASRPPPPPSIPSPPPRTATRLPGRLQAAR